MKGLLLTLGLTAVVATTANTAISVETSKNLIAANSCLENYEKYQTNLIDFMNFKIASDNEEQIKEMILNSVFLVNGEVYVNNYLFDNIQDYELKLLLKDANFEKSIQNMYKNQLLIINEQGKFIFVEFSVQPQIAGVWAESHWYWFGWWKLHFDHSASQSLSYLLDVVSGVSELAEMIMDWYPWSAAMLAVFSAFCFANSLIFDSYDHGKGVWIGWYIIVPDMGWGAN